MLHSPMWVSVGEKGDTYGEGFVPVIQELRLTSLPKGSTAKNTG